MVLIYFRMRPLGLLYRLVKERERNFTKTPIRKHMNKTWKLGRCTAVRRYQQKEKAGGYNEELKNSSKEIQIEEELRGGEEWKERSWREELITHTNLPSTLVPNSTN